MKKVATITRSMSMPIIAAASRSNEVARIALPSRVRETRSRSAATIRTNAPTMTMICADDATRTPPTWKPLQLERAVRQQKVL